ARPGPFCQWTRRLDLLAHERLAVALLYLPARHRIERRRSDRLAGAQAEAGVMPGAAHGVIDHQALGERPAVMRAGRADRENLVAAPGQQHRLVAHAAADHLSVGEIAQRNSLGEVGTLRLRLFGHGILLCWRWLALDARTVESVPVLLPGAAVGPGRIRQTASTLAACRLRDGSAGRPTAGARRSGRAPL